MVGAFLADHGKKWQSMIQTAGSFDPAAGVGVGFRFLSTSPISGVHDPKLDMMLNQRHRFPWRFTIPSIKNSLLRLLLPGGSIQDKSKAARQSICHIPIY